MWIRREDIKEREKKGKMKKQGNVRIWAINCLFILTNKIFWKLDILQSLLISRSYWNFNYWHSVLSNTIAAVRFGIVKHKTTPPHPPPASFSTSNNNQFSVQVIIFSLRIWEVKPTLTKLLFTCNQVPPGCACSRYLCDKYWCTCLIGAWKLKLRISLLFWLWTEKLHIE